jgi:beta-galactosidase
VFVLIGGLVVIGFKSGFAIEYAAVRVTLAPGPLREALGVHYQEFSNLAQPLKLKDDPYQAGTDNKVQYWAEFLELDTAKALAWYDHPFFGRWPAITANRFGAGKAVYEGTYLSDNLQKAVLKSVLQERGLIGPDQELPSHIQTRAGVNRFGKTIRYYFNYSGSPATFTYRHKAGVDLLTSRAVKTDDVVDLAPWDLAIVEEH